MLRGVAAACILALTVSAFASDRAEPNSFLNKRANSVPQLVQEVRTDDAVADRFARHFGKTREELVEYFGTLHLARLNSDGTYMIYLVDDQGVIKAKPQRLKAGTRVFADAAGTPVLKASCGNAMVPGTNAQVTSVNPGVIQASDTLRSVPVTTPESSSTFTQTAVLTPTSPIALAPEMPQVTTGNSNQGFALPAALAALGGAGAILIGSGGHSNPVPEPATMLVMASALIALKARRKKK